MHEFNHATALKLVNCHSGFGVVQRQGRGLHPKHD